MQQADRYWRYTVGLTILVAVLYILPYILLGHNAYIRLHDSLEGEWTWLKLLVYGRVAFDFSSDAVLPQQMKGLWRNAFPSGFSFNTVLVQWFDDYYGYIVSSILIRVIGFIGMLLLLKDYFVKSPESRYIRWACALIFVVLPVFIPFGLTIMGQPLLYWAFINLQYRKKLWISYLIVGLMPLYSSIVWMAMPILSMIGLIGMYYFFTEGLGKHYVVGALLLLVGYVSSNLPMLTLTVFHPGFVPHRKVYDLYMFAGPDFWKCALDFITDFFTTYYHAANFVPFMCFMSILLVLRRTDKLLITVLVLITIICLYQGFYSYPEFWFYKKLELFNSFRFNRYIMLVPFLWVFAFALALEKMRNVPIYRNLIGAFIVVQLFITLMGNDEVLHNYRTLFGRQKFPNYENYFAPKQFSEIKQYIHEPQSNYYVVSLGISPTIAQYNGFYTLDGLASIYDLNYKKQFRAIFAGEIDKSKEIQQYFDGWGNRCYIFSAELGTDAPAYNCFKNKHQVVQHFDFNTKAFTDMGGRYLISAVEIKDYAQHGLQLERVFNDEQSWWTIYLYSVKQSQ